MPDYLITTAIVSYGIVFALVFRHVAQSFEASKLSKLSAGLWLFALICHTAYAGINLFTAEGMALNFYNALTILTWFISLFLLVSAIRYPMESLALIVLPLTALPLLAGLFLPITDTKPLNPSNIGIQWHVLTSLIAFAILSLAAALALLLSYQDRRLRKHQIGGWVRHLPPLQYIESYLFQLITFGYVMLSIALLTGWLYIENLFAQQLIHKTVLSILAWVIFSLLLGGRLLRGWRGSKAVRLTVWGFAFLLLAYFGSKLVLEFILQRP